jgi:uncharacterized protein (DUF983 family)
MTCTNRHEQQANDDDDAVAAAFVVIVGLVIVVFYGLLRSAHAPVMANKLPVTVFFNTSRGLH